MQKQNWIALAALFVTLAAASPAEAQQRTSSRSDDVKYERQDRDDDDHRYGDRQGDERSKNDDLEASRVGDRRGDSRYERNERGNGPSFCRNGRGHPRFGWDWCRERGWDRSGNAAVRWEQRSWEDVVFRIPRDDRRQTLDRRGLGEVLGDVVFGRIDTRGRQLGSSQDYLGRWLTTGNSRELWITAGGIPIARLVDRNGDRRVDSVFTAER